MLIPKINKPSLVIGGVLDILGKSPALWLGENIIKTQKHIYSIILKDIIILCSTMKLWSLTIFFIPS